MSGRHRQESAPVQSDPVPQSDSASRSRRAAGARRSMPVAVAVAAALCVPVAAGVVVLGLHDRADAATDDARTAAVEAARRAAHDVLSYDYRTLDKNIALAKSEATGLFAKQYAQSTDQLVEQARQTRAIVQATPSSPGVVTASNDEVVVLLFVDQASVKQLAGQKTPATRIDQSRVRLTMTKVGGRWLVSQLAAL